MFTGIVSDVGTVAQTERRGDVRFTIETAYDLESIAIGASISCSGVCLTVVEKGANDFAVDVSAETLSRSTLGNWKDGSRINLERSLAMGDELGGHLVSGHVDALGKVVSLEAEGDSVRFTFHAPAEIAPFVAEKGSIAIDGCSLTVNAVEDDADGCSFGINIIPHTQEVTTFGTLQAGDAVNLEIDMLARYMQRMLESRHGRATG
ncbi:MAG: riboflavin synthase [Alphaproteobacteria bacterium]|jgi:riboflavin synthase|nr:riboflavin synthase [Rhodospirillaceae bacterium]MBT6511669.1 riboflavin synthase [Rhodospirillaceae bacterium]MDG2483090.1 riboflavin synthase [Alphaproteobacteria bacterium]